MNLKYRDKEEEKEGKREGEEKGEEGRGGGRGREGWGGRERENMALNNSQLLQGDGVMMSHGIA